MDATILQGALGSGRDAPIVAVIKDDRVFSEPLGLQLLQFLPTLAIHLRDTIHGAGDILARLRQVWLIGRHTHLGWLHWRKLEFLVVRKEATLMADCMVKNAKEGRAFRTVLPGGLTAIRAPERGCIFYQRRVVICLVVIAGVIARIPQIFRKSGQPLRYFSNGAHLMGRT